MTNPPIEFRFQRVAAVRRIEERCRQHARALLPRTGDIERCRVTVSRTPALDEGSAPYEVRVEVRRIDGEVLVDRASAPPDDRGGNDEDIVVQTVDEALHRMRRNLASAEFDTATSGRTAALWSTRKAGSGQVWYG